MLQIDETICFANVLAVLAVLTVLTVLPSCCKAIPIIPRGGPIAIQSY